MTLHLLSQFLVLGRVILIPDIDVAVPDGLIVLLDHFGLLCFWVIVVGALVVGARPEAATAGVVVGLIFFVAGLEVVHVHWG